MGIEPGVLSFKCRSCWFPQQSRLTGLSSSGALGSCGFVVAFPSKVDGGRGRRLVDLPVTVLLYSVGFVTIRPCDSPRWKLSGLVLPPPAPLSTTLSCLAVSTKIPRKRNTKTRRKPNTKMAAQRNTKTNTKIKTRRRERKRR